MGDPAEKVEPQEAHQETFPGFEGRAVRGASIMLAGTVRVDDDVPTIGSYDIVSVTVTGKVIAVDHHHRGKTGLVREQRIEVESVDDVKIIKRGDNVTEISHRHRNDDLGDEGGE